MSNINNKFKCLIVLLVGLFIYSTTGILSKLASKEPTLSSNYILLYFGIIIILGIYALLWQQVLKHVDLSTAMAFKPFVLVLNYLWAVLLFNERLSIKTICGLLIIMIGMLVVGVHNE